MRRLFVSCCVALFLVSLAASTALSYEIQLTYDTDRNHSLDNNLNWSPDSQWLAYDTRDPGGIDDTKSLEKVSVNTKEIVTIYTHNPVHDVGPGTAAVSFFPEGDTVIAIRGIDGVTYQQWARFGAMFSPTDGTATGYVVSDARDVTESFTPGALRGGTHRHEPTGDGWGIGFTYNDQIMENLDHSYNLRTIGCTKLGIPVTVDDGDIGNQDGVGFSVVLTKVKRRADIDPATEPDAIWQASEDAWVGANGYQKPDGTWQRARAFIGKTKLAGDIELREVFIVDVPEDTTQANPGEPLEGTATTMPNPPAGAVTRRLTHSSSSCDGILRASLDGKWIAFRRDGEIQLISPNGGDVIQVTNLPGTAEKPWWDPSGNVLYCISDDSIWSTIVKEGDPDFGTSVRLTDPALGKPDALVVSPDGKWIAFNRTIGGVKQVFITPTPEPSTLVLAALALLGMSAFVRRTRA